MENKSNPRKTIEKRLTHLGPPMDNQWETNEKQRGTNEQPNKTIGKPGKTKINLLKIMKN